MKKYFYRVEFLIKKGGFQDWVIDVEADNAKEAMQIATDKWEGAHMFHLRARKLYQDEEFLYHWFSKTPHVTELRVKIDTPHLV